VVKIDDPIIDVPEELLQKPELFDPHIDGLGFPEPPKKDSLLILMREIVALEDPEKQVKIGNVTKEELGKPKVNVRDALRIAAYAESEGHYLVANYINALAGHTATTGLSKNGLLVQLPFTQRRVSQNLGTPKETTKKAWHGGETKVREGVIDE